mgnify:CR=1 FL=1
MAEETQRIESEDELYKKMFRRRKLLEEQKADDKQRQNELDETTSWYEPAREARQNELGYIDSLIDDWFLRQYEKNPYYRYRSRNGSVSKRSITTWKHDDAKLLENIPDKYIDVKPKVKWGDYKKTLDITDDGKVIDKETGELVDGVTASKSIKVNIKSPEEDKN